LSAARTTWTLVGSGIVALAVAMGIGRFAFTPLLPLMLRDGTLTASAGAEWAAANYGGYLAGALTASRVFRDPCLGLRIAMAGVALTTLAVAWIGDAGLLGAVLRAAAGVFSAWTLVYASSWYLAELARRNATHLGAWIYTGVGAGIALAGALAWVGGRQPASWLWLELGLIAVAGAIAVEIALHGPRASVPVVTRARRASTPRTRRHLALVLCYGVFGFGYIGPATFLPAMARQQISDPLVFGVTWPLFGLAAVLSVAGAASRLSRWPRRRVWALAQATMAFGTALPLVTQALWALAVSGVFVGGTFMVATMAGLQLAREETPADPTPLLARMTVAFAAGQIAGPLLVRAFGQDRWAGWDGIAWANATATVLLALTAAWLGRDAVPASRSPA
jgi:MFS family permease